MRRCRSRRRWRVLPRCRPAGASATGVWPAARAAGAPGPCAPCRRPGGHAAGPAAARCGWRRRARPPSARRAAAAGRPGRRRGQRKCHLKHRWHTRVAGGEQQRQVFVVQFAGNAATGRRLHGQCGLGRLAVFRPRHVAAGYAQRVDGRKPGHPVQPAGRVGRHALRRPDLQRAQRGRLHRVFSQRQVRQAARARQVRHHAAALRGQQRLQLGVGRTFQVRQIDSMRRISIHCVPCRCGQPCAGSSAIASDSHLTMKMPPITSCASA